MTVPSWKACMIAPDEDFGGAPLLRGEVRLDAEHGAVTRATLYATAHGVVTATVDGSPVAADVLSPGWSSYEWRLRYREHDVTDLVRTAPDGLVVVGLALGNGWFRGRLGWGGGRAFYGSELYRQAVKAADVLTEPEIVMTWTVEGLDDGRGWRATT